MGFFKKKQADNEEENRSSLFGSRSSKGKESSASSNPYAQQPASKPDPYASNQAPPPYAGGRNDSDQYRRDDKSPAVTGPGGAYGNQSRYPAGGNGGYGSQGGYGEQRPYGGGNENTSSRYGAGGYGGFGQEDQAGRDALFGNAKDRVQERQQQEAASGGAGSGPAGGPPGGYQSGVSGGYGADYGSTYQERTLTAEEQEEEDVQAAKNEIRFMKQKDVASTRNALRLAQEAEESGMDTLNRLAAQGERIHNTEKHLDLASNQNRLAEEKARELKTLNKSMFAVHVGNPFTSASRQKARDEKILDTHRSERDQRDATRAAAYASQDRQQEFARGMKSTGTGPQSKNNLANRAKYQFEADSEDEALEDEIDSNLDALHGAAKRLNGLSLAMGREVDQQNQHLGRIIKKADKVDDEIALNRSKLDRIH